MKEFKLDNKKRIIEGIDAEEFQILNRIPDKKSEINNVRISNNRITFETEHPNELHIVKVSYFPNWKIENGSAVYRFYQLLETKITHKHRLRLSTYLVK